MDEGKGLLEVIRKDVLLAESSLLISDIGTIVCALFPPAQQCINNQNNVLRRLIFQQLILLKKTMYTL